MSLADIAAKATQTGGPIGAGVQLNTTGAEGGFATHICDVEVDVDLGIVRVLRYTSFQDVGRAIHPGYVEGQMQGGAAQGIGWALNEEYFMADTGEMMNYSLLDYRMPTSLDLPMIDTVIVEIANPAHPYGVRGVGEVPICPPLPAIANAVSRAIGARMNQLPITPGRVLDAIWESEKK